MATRRRKMAKKLKCRHDMIVYIKKDNVIKCDRCFKFWIDPFDPNSGDATTYLLKVEDELNTTYCCDSI